MVATAQSEDFLSFIPGCEEGKMPDSITLNEISFDTAGWDHYLGKYHYTGVYHAQILYSRYRMAGNRTGLITDLEGFWTSRLAGHSSSGRPVFSFCGF